MPQSDRGVNANGAASREVTGKESDADEEKRDANKQLFDVLPSRSVMAGRKSRPSMHAILAVAVPSTATLRTACWDRRALRPAMTDFGGMDGVAL